VIVDTTVNHPGSRGKVFLVGAGPGNPDLLTVRALRLIETADVLVYDRLISREILDLAPPGVTRISVGKSSGNHSVDQSETNRMLVALAGGNRIVVRLKGGDPFVFGRGSEEAQHLARAGICFEVVPGVTAATACSAYAGIPLTHRGVSRGFRVVTGHLLENGDLELDWQSLADPECTLVIYMGLATLRGLSTRLVRAGLSPSLPAAAIENGTTVQQRVVHGTLETLPRQVQAHGLRTPTLLVLGHCVDISREIQWFDPISDANELLQSASVWSGS
jgi:uroporphyrin-III C-methyltransferase/precorrin-2 dehydrogenase/sirohydrochlorin ferrochelatase/uroporphyrin-III C-methyltransferase